MLKTHRVAQKACVNLFMDYVRKPENQKKKKYAAFAEGMYKLYTKINIIRRNKAKTIKN